MTEQPQPTDAEILDAADDFRSQYKHGGTTFDEFNALGFARAVLAKWGTPAGAGEVVAWMDDFGNTFPLAANKGAGSWLDAHKRNWKPLYATTQPAQAQAGVVPFNKTQRTNLFNNRDLASEKNMGVKLTLAEWHRIVQYIEAAHGIKGADHGVADMKGGTQ